MANLPHLLLGNSPGMRAARALAEVFGPTDVPIVLLGERGTGKTVFARYLHHLSRPAGPFVKANLSMMSGDLQYSALMGHARGSFTGAQHDREGFVESAHQGTLFLDEIGQAGPATHQLLLTLLDDRAIRRLGENRVRPVDVRLFIATNANLEQRAADGSFPPDLLDRFGYARITFPPLRERRDDIPELARTFVERTARRYHIEPLPAISDTVLEHFRVAPWPGNIRGLESACQYATIMARGRLTIEPEDVPEDLVGELEPPRTSRLVDDEILLQTMELLNGNKAATARRLRLSRTTVHKRMKALNL
jgi:DNA-binding NtrC family response regulator